MHVQLTMWYGLANHNGNGENKHDKVIFQLAAVDLNSYGPKSLRQTPYCNR